MRALILTLVLLLPSTLYAADDVKREKLIELVNIMNMDSMVDGMYSQMESMMQGLSKQMDIKPSEQHIFDKSYKEMVAIMKDEMSWSKMEPLILEIYDKNFSEKEINDMLVFYKTPTGQSLLKKMPMIMQESMHMSQQLMQSALPKIRAMSVRLADELKQHRAKE